MQGEIHMKVGMKCKEKERKKTNKLQRKRQ
jgi:hypothetical protein